MRPLIVLAVVAVALVAGCSASESNGATNTGTISAQSVNGGSGGTGGSVTAGAPAVPAFASDKSSVDNGGSGVVTFAGTAFSPNGEANLKSLTLAGTGPSTLGSSHAISATDLATTSEPASFGADGWKVWDPTPRDGSLSYKVQVPVPVFTTAGAYSFVLTVLDQASATATSTIVGLSVTKFSLITVAGAPVNAAGSPLTGQSWGAWSAAPGATNVTSTNYLKLTNDGDRPNPSVVISFSSPAFTGATDANWTIPINGHIQFAWAEGAPTSIPSALTFTYGATSPSGSVTVNFAAKGDVVFVIYRLTDLPAVLPKQSYGAAFTVTEL